MMNLSEQKLLLDQNYLPLQVFSDKVIQSILDSKLYQVGDYNGTMGCKLLSPGEHSYIIKSDIKGVYVVYLRYNNHNIVLYVGETDKSLGTRIGRLIKQATGDNRDDESHSAGQLLFDQFTKYNRMDLWKNKLYVKFIELREIKNILGLVAFPKFDLEGEHYCMLKDLDNKVLLKYFEEKTIDSLSPISNKMAQSFENTNNYSENFNKFCELVNSFDKKTDSIRRSKPYIEPSIAKKRVA